MLKLLPTTPVDEAESTIQSLNDTAECSRCEGTRQVLVYNALIRELMLVDCVCSPWTNAEANNYEV